MPSDTKAVLRLVTLLALAAGVALVGFVGAAAADDHGKPWPSDADIENATDDDFPYRFEFFPDDPTPGAEGVTYTSFSGALEPIDGTDGYDEFDTIRLFYDEGTINCEAQNARVFGVDRGGNNSGTEVDESWIEHVEESDYQDDRTYVDFFEEDDFAGDPPWIRSGDIVKSQQADCYENPEEPGWYHVVSFSNGTYEGEYAESWVRSEPFYICDCEDEEEAREKLGPPPHERSGGGSETAGDETASSEPTETPEPTDDSADGEASTSSETDGDDDSTDSDSADGDEGSADAETPAGDDEGSTDDSGDGSAESDDSADPETPTETEGEAPAETEDGPTGTEEQESTETDDAESGEAAIGGTPTVEDGPGFGAVVALFAVAVASLLRRRVP